jgi:pimeloyl-ACP methyl ester carboxylesterase
MRRMAGVVGAIAVVGALWGSLYAMGMHPAHPVTTVIRGPGAPGAPRRLLVFVKGTGANVDAYKPLLFRLQKEPSLANTDLLLFDHRLVRLTTGRAYDFSTRLRAEIDAQWIRNGAYDEVILAGHSYGSTLVREAYLQSAGRDPRQTPTVPWSQRVTRVVLLAGIGRGVDAEEHGRWSFVLRAGRFIPLIRSSVMYDILRGADFVTDVRIAWIRYMSELTRDAARDPEAHRPPIVVQVMGTEDDVLHRDDNIDLEQFPSAYQIDVPGAFHGQTLYNLSLVSNPELVYGLLREAFVSSAPARARLQHRAAPDSIHRVIFLLHGMRSSRDEWVREIAPLLRRRLPDAEVVESSYGWISLASFGMPWVRRREIRWLQDQYTEYLARHPDASFDVIAHSNGAYIVGQALEHVPSLRFKRVVLLGSVLPSDYSWEQRRQWRQAENVRTDRSADDLVVAVFCSALRGLGMTDIGTSGWSGFENSAGVEREVAWYHGGHSAALARSNLTSLTEFLATGAVGDSLATPDAGPTTGVTFLSQLAPWLARLALLASFVAGALWIRRAPSRRNRAALLAAAAVTIMILLDVV